MKWLLIFFLSIIIIPVFAQNTMINQTEYQRLGNSINGIQTGLEKISNSINETHPELQKDYRSLGENINETRVEAKNYYMWSLYASGVVAIVAFLGSLTVAVIIAKRQDKQSEKIAINTSAVGKLTEKIVHMIEKQDTLLRDRQSVYATSIIRWIDTEILDIDKYMKTWYPQYQGASGAEKDNIMNNIISTYKLHLQTLMLPIKSIDLVEIFGKEISDDWLRLWIKCMGDIVYVDDPQGMESLKERFDKIVEQAQNLKQKLSQF